MDEKKMRRALEQRLKQPGRLFKYDRETETVRVENEETGKGLDIALSPLVAKWHVRKDKAIDEVEYYVEEALKVMGKDQEVAGQEKKIYPVIRSTSFPKETGEGVPFFTDDHTAETRIYYGLDLGKTYRLLDEQMIKREGLDPQKVREMARFNVRSLPVKLKKDTLRGNDFYFLNTNDGYDASRILNEKFLQEKAETIEGDMIVAVPHQDVLIIGDIRNTTGYDILSELTMSFFTTGKVPITALSFTYEEGKLEPIFILAQDQKKSKKKEKE